MDFPGTTRCRYQCSGDFRPVCRCKELTLGASRSTRVLVFLARKRTTPRPGLRFPTIFATRRGSPTSTLGTTVLSTCFMNCHSEKLLKAQAGSCSVDGKSEGLERL